MNATIPQRPSLFLGLALAGAVGLSACADDGKIAAVSATLDVQGAPLGAPVAKAAAPAREPAAEATPGAEAAVVEAAGKGASTDATEAATPEAEPAPTPEELLIAADYELLEDGTARATFLDLDFPEYLPPDQREPDEPEVLALGDFPERIRLLNERRVAMDGFMLVANWKDKKIERFMLGRFPPGCCFGAIPVYYEWIDVFPDTELTTDYSPWYPITVTGVLEVGEKTDEDGYVESIYRMSAESVEELE